MLIASPNPAVAGVAPVSIYSDIIEEGAVFTWNIKNVYDGNGILPSEYKNNSEITVTVTLGKVVMYNGSHSAEQIIFEERVDGKLIDEFYTEGRGTSTIDPCNFLAEGCRPISLDYQYIRPISLQYENGTVSNVFEEERIEFTSAVSFEQQVEVKYLKDTDKEESYEKIEMVDQDGVLIGLSESWHDSKTGLLNRKYENWLGNRIDIIREGYELNDGGELSITFPYLIIAPTMILIYLVKRSIDRKER